MVTVAVLSADQRLSFQIHTWLKDLADNVRWETHTDLAEFAIKIETEVAAELIELSKNAGDIVLDAEDIGSGKSKVITDVFYRLLIIDLDLFQTSAKDSIEWASKLKKTMAEKERSDPLQPVKVLFLAFEGGSFKVDAFRDPMVDDLILKPLDRSVFLQKVEIMTSDDPGVKPTFLFRQKTNVMIEIGKDAFIDEISEFAMAIRNPAALANGVFASIHCSVLGQGDLSRIIGRVYRSEPHPSLEGQFLVRFGFFGLRSDQLTSVKKFIRARQTPPKHRLPQLPIAENDPSTPFNRAAVIDMDLDVFSDIRTTLKDHYVGVQTTHYLSYARLLAALSLFFPANQIPKVEPSNTNPAPKEPEVFDDAHQLRAWTSQGSLSVIALSLNQELLRFETSLSSGDTVFGRTRLEWNESPRDFFAGLDKQDSNELQEMIVYAISGGTGRSFLKMSDQARRIYFIEAEATLLRVGEGEESSQIQIELKQIEKDDYLLNAAKGEEKEIQAAELLYDAIFIDVNLIRRDLEPWYDGLNEAYMKAGILTPGAMMPKIILLANEKSRIQPENYRKRIVSDFIYKPLDRRVLSFKAKTSVNDFIPRKEPDIPPFVRTDLVAKLAKDARMVELSEYGLSISHPTAFRRGAMMRFFSPLLGGGVDGVLGRCTHCEKKEEKEVSYLCHFTFFGTPDENLKRIRTWIREDYVLKKEPT